MRVFDHHLRPGQRLTISVVAYSTAEAFSTHCTPVQVVRTTPKAVKVEAGGDEIWLPLSALTPSSNREGFYLLAKWVTLEGCWAARFAAATSAEPAG